MASLTFVINDSSTGGSNPSVEVTITENADGTLSFNIRQLQYAGAYIGDLRGFFFDLPDSQENALAGMTATNQVKNPDGSGSGYATQSNAAVVGNDTVMSAGGSSNNMNGLNSGGNGYDFGLEIGSEGVGKGGDDVRSFSFTLDATKNLTLADFANATFGVRVMSVGQDVNGDGSIDTARNGSSKISETTFTYITPVNDDTGCVDEDTTATGNILTNDGGSATLDVLSVTNWKLGAATITVGSAHAVANAEGATVTLNANGSWSIDATAADALSEGEHISEAYTVTVKQDHYVDGAHLNLDGTYTTTETFTVTICGVNDGPVAHDDDFTGEAFCMPEAGSLVGQNVLADNGNGADSDIDRLDTISVTGIRDADGNLVLLKDSLSGASDGDDTATVTLESGAIVTIHSDGSFVYNTNGAFTALSTGEMAEDSFVYQLSDNHGGADEATATVCIDGEGTPGGGGGGGEGPTPPAPQAALSHGYWMTHNFTDSEGFAGAVGSTSLDDYFNIDSPLAHTWTDATGGGPGATVLNLDDLSFARAVAFGNGSGASGDTMTPNPGGTYDDLVREAATAVLNYYDAQSNQSFVDWYIYERTVNDNDANASNNPYDSASVLADLRAQVEATIEGAPGAYSVGDLSTILHATHH